ncbi:kinase-like domain-containing protein [Hypoxylon sp. FL1150]|nr:kinase-like domain-containing protein [Hypoxylon sp. FL1150]
MESPASTNEINDVRHSSEDGILSREVRPIESEPMHAMGTSDITHSGTTSQEDHNMIPEGPESNFSTNPSSGLDSQNNPDQALSPLARPTPIDIMTDEATQPIFNEIDHQSDARFSTPETVVPVDYVSPSEQTVNDDITTPPPHNDLDTEDESEIDDDEDTAEIQFPNYMMYPSEYTEDIYLYRPGGHHPVHLGDILDDRFEVIHKLGFGGFSTVWLCLQIKTHEWRAIKIVRADESSEDMPELDIMSDAKKAGEFDPGMWEANHISLPLEHFWIEGPNGSHLCEVLRVHGPSVEDKWTTRPQDGGLAKLNDTLFQVASGVKFLHDRGICHGDLTPRNILVRLGDISHIGKQEMLDLLGEPEREDVYASDVDPAPMAPKYKVVPITTKALGRLGMVDELVIADFGEAFRPSEEDVQWSGIPLQFAAPEAALRCKPQLPSDIWSLACDMLLSVTNVGLVDPVRNTCAYVAFLEAALGALPEPYRTAHIDHLKETLEDSGEDWKDYVGSGNKGNPQAYIPEDSDNLLQIMSEPSFYNSIKRNYNEGATQYGYENPIHILLARSGGSTPIDEATPTPLSDEEIQLLGDLLIKMIKYDPAERLDIDGVLRHEWFTKQRASIDRNVTASHAGWVATNVDKVRNILTFDSTDMSDDGSRTVTCSPVLVGREHPIQFSPLPVIQSTDPAMMGSLLTHDPAERVPDRMETTHTVFQHFCVGFFLVVMIPALYTYLMLLVVFPLFLRMLRRAGYPS